MEHIQFAGENLFPGQLGHFLLLLAFVAVLFSTLSFIQASRDEIPAKDRWRRMGRIGYWVHSIAVISAIFTLFYIIHGHYYEYHYVWRHSSNALPVYYMFACFWEGQEGSFLLWMFWMVWIGLFLMHTAKRWEAPVMSVFGLVQLVLSSMLIGIFLFEQKLGSNPFTLLREEMANAPIFQRANYLEFIKDGNGLNPLLQNYWMVIHPPTLFLGFSLTTVPFAFAVAALFKKSYTDWVKPVLPWTLAAVAVLATGIIMGAAWAYEALSFGGFWAWDPVENASLIPWLTLVAGLHTLLAYKHSGYALRPTFMFFILTFFLVLYSTFLTRSGILGDSSVHSFTDLGMSGQLLVFIFMLIIPAVYLLIRNYRAIPSPKKEEETYTREFWMFIAALVLLLSMLHICLVTSIPVFNTIFGTNFAPPVDPIEHYNKIQLPLVVCIALLSACTQYFNYKKTKLGQFFKKIRMALIVTVIISGLMIAFAGIRHWGNVLLMLGVVFTIVANSFYLFSVLSAKIKIGGGSVTHIGFGLFVLGLVFSGGQKEVISINRSGKFFEGFDSQENVENIMLPKKKAVQMANYLVTYQGEHTEGPNRYFEIQFDRLLENKQEIVETFTLYPNVQMNEQMGDVANPDTRHYLSHDIYTHVTAVSTGEIIDTAAYESTRMSIGDTLSLNEKFLVLDGFSGELQLPGYRPREGDIAVTALISIHTLDSIYQMNPMYIITSERFVETIEAKMPELGLKIKLLQILPDEDMFEIAVSEHRPVQDYVILRAILFPFVNLLWLGAGIMVAGILLSMSRRIRENKKSHG